MTEIVTDIDENCQLTGQRHILPRQKFLPFSARKSFFPKWFLGIYLVVRVAWYSRRLKQEYHWYPV